MGPEHFSLLTVLNDQSYSMRIALRYATNVYFDSAASSLCLISRENRNNRSPCCAVGLQNASISV